MSNDYHLDWQAIRQEYETTDAQPTDLAKKYGVSAGTVRSRKAREGWTKSEPTGENSSTDATQRLQGDECNATPINDDGVALRDEPLAPKKRGAPKGKPHASKKGRSGPPGNQNAKGNRGGKGGPYGNKKNLKFGFFSKILPDDPETHAIVEAISEKNPIDILWENIVIQYVAIARAQKIMFVKDKEDITEHLRREKESESGYEREFEIQFPWDKHAAFLTAQSRAMSTLQGMIAKYEELCKSDLATEEQKARIAKLKAEVAKIENPDENKGMSWAELMKLAGETPNDEADAN
ncbi:hypothetical protein H1S01_03290 [Heliobacterium chlorum]|uniref:Terminase small subunit n=1 Tax=Heliobacterium chlorum TaxID=2698 RepID=A0ABR7T1M0_HELCL|nr:phage terminase small subunit [Heliobacterium chlorum]MBC9783536.1 hypothetical protein [Heliobacterium chlorum]